MANLPEDLVKTLVGMRKGLTKGKAGISGIGIDEDCISLFNLIRTRSIYQWVIFKVNDAGSSVGIERVGQKGSSYADFLEALPANQSRYIVGSRYPWP